MNEHSLFPATFCLSYTYFLLISTTHNLSFHWDSGFFFVGKFMKLSEPHLIDGNIWNFPILWHILTWIFFKLPSGWFGFLFLTSDLSYTPLRVEFSRLCLTLFSFYSAHSTLTIVCISVAALFTVWLDLHLFLRFESFSSSFVGA